MCGFTCIIEKSSNCIKDYSNTIHKMLEEISHRGPDEQKISIDKKNGIYMGFCRLSMVDIKMSMQPFWDVEHKTAIMFNGEIYNYKILRREFTENTFYTKGEAELLLNLYKRYGESFVNKLDGTPNGVRADKLDDEMIRLMIASGITSLSIAAESGNERIRTEIIHKNLKTENIIEAIQICDKYDLPCIVFFVLGFPGETIDDIRETIQFAKRISELYGTINMIFIANPLPGTELNREALKNGYIKKDLENSDYFVAIRANQAPIIETENFNKKKIFFLLKEELDLPMYSVHNITQPMFWYNSPKTNSRAQRAFPRMSNRRVEWKWIDEE